MAVIPRTDREILVSLDAKLSNMASDVREMKEIINAKASHESVSSLELRVRHTERRVGAVERKFWMASGAFAVVMFLLKILPGVLK